MRVLVEERRARRSGSRPGSLLRWTGRLRAPCASVWFLRLAAFVRVKHGLGEALQTAAAQAEVNETEAPVAEAIGVLLQADARSGLEPADVLLVMGFLWSVGPGDAGEQQARRVLDLAICELQ